MDEGLGFSSAHDWDVIGGLFPGRIRALHLVSLCALRVSTPDDGGFMGMFGFVIHDTNYLCACARRLNT